MSKSIAKKHTVKDSQGKDIVVRSKLETQIVDLLNEFNSIWDYEVTKIPYTVPESKHTYTVDFTLKNGIQLEGKGYLSDYQERNKYVLLKQQNPNLDLRFIFANPNKLCGGTKQTHAQWAIKQGFKYCSITDYEQIKSWVKEQHE